MDAVLALSVSFQFPRRGGRRREESLSFCGTVKAAGSLPEHDFSPFSSPFFLLLRGKAGNREENRESGGKIRRENPEGKSGEKVKKMNGKTLDKKKG